MKIIFVFAFLVGNAIVVFAQKPAKLVDEFATVTCEDLLARTDNFQLMLQQDSAARGVVVISRGTDSNRANWYRILINNTMRRRDLDMSRVDIYRGDETAKTGGSFWILPPDGELPSSAREIWSQGKNLDLSKPIMIGSEDETGVCPTFVPGDFADLIKKNPEIIGKIIVHAESNWEPATLGLPWLDEFVNKYGVPRRRLKLIYGKRSKTIGYTEFWVVPMKK